MWGHIPIASRSVSSNKYNRNSHRSFPRPMLGVLGALVLVGLTAGCGTKLDVAASDTTNATSGSDTTVSSETTSVPPSTDVGQPTTSDAGGLSGTNSGLGSKLGDEAVSLPGLNTGSSDDAFGPDVERCLDSEASGLSDADADAVQNGDDFSGLSPEGTRIVTEAMNTCIPADSLSQVFADEFFKSLGSTPDPEFTSCLDTELEGQVGDVIIQSSEAATGGGDDIPQPVLDLLDACGDIIIGDLFVDQFEEQGLPSDTAECIADGLSGQLTMSDLIELGQGGEVPPELETEIENLAIACATTN